jgi:4-hydroxyphenylpyruvate dioxygenase
MEFGEVVRSEFILHGENCSHIFVERKIGNGVFLPGYKNGTDYNPNFSNKILITMVGNVWLERMNTWVKFYEDVMGFVNFPSLPINNNTEYLAFTSKVMSNGNGRIKFPINEPAEGKKKNLKLKNILDFYGGPGIQHTPRHR